MEFKMVIFSGCTSQGTSLPEAAGLAATLNWLHRMKDVIKSDFGNKQGAF